jgi:superfamily II DNA helicase RecQ
MRDQVRRASAFGLRAFAYCGKKHMSDLERSDFHRKLKENKIDLLLMTAEMLEHISQDVREFNGCYYIPELLRHAPALKQHPPDMSTASWEIVPLLVIDEIHYIAEAGHDFPLSYNRVWSSLINHRWFINCRKLGLTATVTKRVMDSLFQNVPEIKSWTIVRGTLYRENIRYVSYRSLLMMSLV